jgi:AbrB family looped-hinge helix DNA binding protein
MSVTRVSRKGQITLHKDVRKKLGIKPGDMLEEEVVNGEIILKPSDLPSVTLKGIGRKTKRCLKANATELVRSMRREDREES